MSLEEKNINQTATEQLPTGSHEIERKRKMLFIWVEQSDILGGWKCLKCHEWIGLYVNWRCSSSFLPSKSIYPSILIQQRFVYTLFDFQCSGFSESLNKLKLTIKSTWWCMVGRSDVGGIFKQSAIFCVVTSRCFVFYDKITDWLANIERVKQLLWFLSFVPGE